jgi:hypothetical protein
MNNELLMKNLVLRTNLLDPWFKISCLHLGRLLPCLKIMYQGVMWLKVTLQTLYVIIYSHE